MKKEYLSPDFELLKFNLSAVMSGEVVVSYPQIPDDEINNGELE